MSKAKRGKVWPGLLVAATLLPIADAQASSFVPLRAAELAKADLIVRAVAREVNPRGSYDPNGLPCTVVRLEVLEVIKGGARTRSLEFCSLGGIEPDGRVSVPIGAPSFNKDETYLLFLKTTGWAITPVVNWTLGALREVQDGDRQILVSGEGEGVTNINEEGVQVGGRVDKPEQIRLLQANDIPMDILEVDNETGLEASYAETMRRRTAARAACPSREELESRLREKLPLHEDRVVADLSTLIDPYSVPLMSQGRTK